MKKKKILLISIGHPELSKGGAETAAYNLFNGLCLNDQLVHLLARNPKSSHGGSVFSKGQRENELFLHCSMQDFFLLSISNKEVVLKAFREFLVALNPQVVHFHHYIHLGLELFLEVKKALPKAKIVLTLHEFIAICFHNGQMVKTNKSHSLCYRSSSDACAECFPEKSPGDFFLRERYIKSYFEVVDRFISPSQFLMERYVDWGISREKICVIENGQPDCVPFSPRKLDDNDPFRNRFSFFGQLNQYKGIDVLLEAFSTLPMKIRRKVFLDIYGANIEMQPVVFQNRFKKYMDAAGKQVILHGTYEPREMPILLEKTDWVIIPSIWWENSPMVIQESFNHGRPMIGSNIGGIKEKLEGKGGLLFHARDSSSLRDRIIEALSDDVWRQKVSEIKNTSKLSDIVEQHLMAYYS